MDPEEPSNSEHNRNVDTGGVEKQTGRIVVKTRRVREHLFLKRGGKPVPKKSKNVKRRSKAIIDDDKSDDKSDNESEPVKQTDLVAGDDTMDVDNEEFDAKVGEKKRKVLDKRKATDVSDTEAGDLASQMQAAFTANAGLNGSGPSSPFIPSHVTGLLDSSDTGKFYLSGQDPPTGATITDAVHLIKALLMLLLEKRKLILSLPPNDLAKGLESLVSNEGQAVEQEVHKRVRRTYGSYNVSCLTFYRRHTVYCLTLFYRAQWIFTGLTVCSRHIQTRHTLYHLRLFHRPRWRPQIEVSRLGQ